MSSLLEIKRRIRSVENTKKITKAMKLVATTKLRRSRQSLEQTQVFYHNVYEVLSRLFAQIEDLAFLNKKNAQQRALFIMINSSVGLCGAYNIGVNKLAMEKFQENDQLIVLGTKGVIFWRNMGYFKNIFKSYDVADDQLNYDLCTEIGSIAYGKYLSGEVDKIYLCYTEYKSAISFVPRLLQLFPVDKKALNVGNDFHDTTEFEPNVEGVVAAAIPLYFNAMIFGGMTEAKVCENASRRNAMETATDNAQDLKERLTLQYNRARQTSITQEISEIIAGSSS